LHWILKLQPLFAPGNQTIPGLKAKEEKRKGDALQALMCKLVALHTGLNIFKLPWKVSQYCCWRRQNAPAWVALLPNAARKNLICNWIWMT